MKILLVTEKCDPDDRQRDGGARLVDSLRKAFGDSLQIMQFGSQSNQSATWNFNYPIVLGDRFKRRVANAEFIAKQVKAIEKNFTHIIFVHISMQFGLIDLPLDKRTATWTFPMFLTPSYKNSGEDVPKEYTEIERITLANSLNILTPSHLEKKQLMEFYSISEEQIHVVPRGLDMSHIKPCIRSLGATPSFCSVGSIKPQKNTLGLVELFAKVLVKFPGATLHIIGPAQNNDYYIRVIDKINILGLQNNIELTGHLTPTELSYIIKDCHLHISTSLCETFGRSIFETLASGIPNVVRLQENAAAEYLAHLPYAKFVEDDDSALNAIDHMLSNLSKLSSMAIEIGGLYDDVMLGKLIAAKIHTKDVIAISDFDGTLFHKDNSEKTKRSIEAFRSFQTKVICSARSNADLLEQIKFYDLNVDWIIGYSGAMVTKGDGQLLWLNPLDLNLPILKDLLEQATIIKNSEKALQVAIPLELLPNIMELNIFGLNVEIYQKTAFISSWEASKLRAIHRLLNHINWSGNIKAFGDGIYDSEFLTYFDGDVIALDSKNNIKMSHLRRKSEIICTLE
jgi:glycosyltransferase involved in cell wall biosynthesis/hydroxymethylpyrimidine pyrophosphatase-like HAD family hydrolase